MSQLESLNDLARRIKCPSQEPQCPRYREGMPSQRAQNVPARKAKMSQKSQLQGVIRILWLKINTATGGDEKNRIPNVNYVKKRPSVLL